jgi:hypothetical protein
MKVVVLPSFVGISICWSIMALLARFVIFGGLRMGVHHDCKETAA